MRLLALLLLFCVRLCANPFDGTLLVIHYNFPFYDSIEFLKELYEPVFGKNIVVYGPEEHPGVHAVPTYKGWYFSRVVSDCYKRFPNYEGYVFLQDDCLLHYWNWKKLDTNSFYMKNPTFRTVSLNKWQPEAQKESIITIATGDTAQ